MRFNGLCSKKASRDLNTLRSKEYAPACQPIGFAVRGIVCIVACLFVEMLFAQQPSRQQWTTSRVKGTPDAPLPLTIERVFADVEMNHPTEMIRLPGTDRWVVTQTGARVHSFSASRRPRSAIGDQPEGC